jgi:hypothetical protein
MIESLLAYLFDRKRIVSLSAIFFVMFFDVAGLQAQQNIPVELDGSQRNNVLTSVPFLLIMPQARAGAMGNAGVAIEADANSASMNMAAMAYLK